MSGPNRDRSPERPVDARPALGTGGCLVAFVAHIGGFGAAAVAWILVLRAPPWTFGVRDAAYWTCIAAAIAARHVVATRFSTSPAPGEEERAYATPRSALLVFTVAALAWLAAQALTL